MNGPTLWGLVSAGRVNRSFLSRLPALKTQLGPVFSTSYRLASRLSNSLRAGIPVRTSAELQTANPIFLFIPGGSVDQLLDAAFLDSLEWSRKQVLICDRLDQVPVAAELSARGAYVGILAAVPGSAGLFVVSGERAALLPAKAAVRSMKATALEVDSDRLPYFQAAVTLTGSLFTPLLETAVECLRQSGLEQQVAAKTADALLQQSLRGFKRAGRKSWSGPIALADHQAIETQRAALKAVKPVMADYFRDAARFGFELYQTFPELTRYDKARWQQFRKHQSA